MASGRWRRQLPSQAQPPAAGRRRSPARRSLARLLLPARCGLTPSLARPPTSGRPGRRRAPRRGADVPHVAWCESRHLSSLVPCVWTRGAERCTSDRGAYLNAPIGCFFMHVRSPRPTCMLILCIFFAGPRIRSTEPRPSGEMCLGGYLKFMAGCFFPRFIFCKVQPQIQH